MQQDRPHRRRRSRSDSPSPVPSKHKRSWQNTDGDRHSGRPGGRHDFNQHPPAGKGGKGDFRSPAKVSDRRNYRHSPARLHKNQPSHTRKTGHVEDRDVSAPYPHHPRAPSPRRQDKPMSVSHKDRAWPRALSKQRSASVRPPRVHEHREESKVKRLSPSPKPGPSMKMKRRPSSASLSPVPKHSRSTSRRRSPASSSQTKNLSAGRSSRSVIPQRKVSSSSSSKRKATRITLHKRFTYDDQDPLEIDENVTIAILRKPDAQPSEDVTVKKVFEPSQFKMIHKKTEGRKPIFDREEIKVWRHDENLTDDPDYEYRVVRVKSSRPSKSASRELPRMSSDVIRKAIGQQDSGKSNVLSSHAEPEIRLDPRPDLRYESKFRQQAEKEDESRSVKRRDGDKKRGFTDRRDSSEDRDSKGYVRNRKWEDDKREERGKGETYDLRQALERRRSDKEDGGFRIEVRHDSVPEAGDYYTDSQQVGRSNTDRRRFPPNEAPGRSVVVDENRARKQFGGSFVRDRGSNWNARRFNEGQGFVARNRGRRREWSPGRGDAGGAMRDEAMNNFRDDRNFDQRQKFSNSPPPTRGWRGGYRGNARGRLREYVPFEPDFTLPAVINDSFKYSQHDDRDASPKPFPFRGRGGRGRFGPRNFGGKNFRAVTRGSRGGFRGFRGGMRGRGFGSQGDRRSVERVRDISVDREWKHDMYDSLETKEEQPHSTTEGN
ncbi:hypothetical protein BsWGS_21614 [Bradybaena similaris]